MQGLGNIRIVGLGALGLTSLLPPEGALGLGWYPTRCHPLSYPADSCLEVSEAPFCPIKVHGITEVASSFLFQEGQKEQTGSG